MKVNAPIYRIVVVQFVVALTAGTLCLFVDKVVAYSVLLGGLTCAVPSAFIAWRMSRGVAYPGTALKHLVRGELGKLALTAVLFAQVFYWVKPLEVGYFFLALIVGMLCNVLVPLLSGANA